ncbi:endonuclease [Actinomyces sp. oral taxon 414]|uniref:endonuclease/exonuclease/phosphatase family protein n=1 Tax=Actinomyces sp. oral taxon 414 TaxID=712122 RepID=UPI0006B04A78|nr:endonuclease/exonuclease/phosphatase family protein [Actinomyces sp. oral taxon 414]ALC99998.1 endonuclease [Actinomyces sp. oral taxon 414]
MIRLLSLNLQHGRPGDGARLDPATAPLADLDIADAGAAREVLAALADQIRDIDPDVIALQEVDLGQRRSGRLDQTAVLADLLGWAGHRFAATYAGPVVGLRRRPRRSALTGRADDVLGPLRALLGAGPAGFGNALLTRLPVRAWRVARLGRGPAVLTRRGGGRAFDPRSYELSTSTMRNMIAAQIDPVDYAGGAGPDGAGAGGAGPDGARPGGLEPGGLAVASTHLATRTDTAAAQLAAAWAALAALPGPHVLAGDLNLHAELLAPLGIARTLGQGATYPSGAPVRRIDHVLTDPWPTGADGLPVSAQEVGSGAGGALLRAVGSGVRSLVVSDHAATWVDLEPVARRG